MIILRPYQQKTIKDLYEWFRHNTGHPVLNLPTGAGKSVIIAEICKDALQNWPDTRILMVTHTRELIAQNAEKVRAHWPNAPLGIYSAGMGRREIEPITFAGIQTVRGKATMFGYVDLVIIDECFVAGTKILTPAGEKDIDKVRCGDIVYNLSGFGVVEAVSCKPAQETYTLELSNGRSIECTPNHPFLTSEGWKRAKELENGSDILSLKNMSSLWSDIQSLDEEGREREDSVGNVGTFMEKAKFLLREVCKEIQPDSAGCSSQKKNKRYAEKDKASAYKAWRKRAIAAFTTAGASSCSWDWLGCRAHDKNQYGTPEWCVSECLQSGHSEPRKNDSDRAGREEPQDSCETITRSKESGSAGVVRVVSVSSNKRKGAVPVYNLQVSGHPSYFANGVAVHNCHLVNHREEGAYRTLLAELTQINPQMRVIGLTASPFRLGHGLITEKPAIFDDIIEPVSIEELQYQGYLSKLVSKVTRTRLITEGVHKRGGDYIESELQKAVDTDDQNTRVVDEVLSIAGDRRHWLFFCTGIAHAEHVRDVLRSRGVKAEAVTGKTAKHERDSILDDFKRGNIKAVTNANILTTGFDFPDIDLIVMMRPTMSPGLYLQQAGRGLRLKSHTDHCLVLDFAGVVEQHGPITAVKIPRKNGEGDGIAPSKICPNCDSIIAAGCRVCPDCGYEYPEEKVKELDLHLRDVDIMGKEAMRLECGGWFWQLHTGKTSGKQMLMVEYMGVNISDRSIREYILIFHDGYPGYKAAETMKVICKNAGVDWSKHENTDTLLADLNYNGRPPSEVFYRKDGKFYKVVDRNWSN